MSTGCEPVRRLRNKTCVSRAGAVLERQLPRGSPSLSEVSVRSACQGSRLGLANMIRTCSGTGAVATVASFLGVRALGRFLSSGKHACHDEVLWRVLLQRASRSVYALSVGSARASISRMRARPCGVRSAYARNSCVQLSNCRWCLDLRYREHQLFSAVVPVQSASDEKGCDFQSLFLPDSAAGTRTANLVPLDQLPRHILKLVDNSWNGTTDRVLHSQGWAHDPQLWSANGFRGAEITCSLWLCDLRSREVVAGVRRDARWPRSDLFRFYLSKRSEWTDLLGDSDSDVASNETPCKTGRVLEIWVPFRCSCNVEGAYDLSCSVEAFIAHGTIFPDDPRTREVPRGCEPEEDPTVEWERLRAGSWDVLCALSGCPLRSAGRTWTCDCMPKMVT